MKKAKLCNLTFILVIFVFLSFFSFYFMGSTFFNTNDLEAFKDDVMLQTISLAIIFVILTFLYTFYRFNQRVNKQHQTEQQKKILAENQELKSSLTVDLLTSLHNKKYFDERFEKEFKRAIRDNEFISLVIVDIDEFSAFVDIYGENDGNECLKLVANILLNHCNRPGDLVARIEGDKFYVLLPNTKDAKPVSNRCVKSVEQMQILHENSIASNVVTISVGTSCVEAKNIEQKEQLLTDAQASLDKAKKSGRNRVD